MLSNEVGWFDLDENNTGALTSILAANATLVRSALADRLSTIVQNLALTATAFVIAFTLSWRIAAVVIASLPLLIGASIAEVRVTYHHYVIMYMFQSSNCFFILNPIYVGFLDFISAATVSKGIWRGL